MLCPFCRRDEIKVIDSRGSAGNSIRRRRECLACGRRFTTYEKVEQATFRVVKRSGRRVPFDREKLRAGVDKACSKRPIPDARLDRLVSEVEAEILEEFPREVPSRVLGERVLDALRELDDVAAVRYASVLRGFEGVAEFAEEAELQRATVPR